MHVRIIFYGHSYIINKKYVSFLKILLIYYYVYDMIVRNQIIFLLEFIKYKTLYKKIFRTKDHMVDFGR
jgi:hypothetical protein